MKHIISFNHISNQLSVEEVEKLRRWYRFYYKLTTCYRWKYKRLQKINIALNITSVSLIVIGDILAPFTHLATLSIAGLGLIIQGYISKSDINSKKQMCWFAYTSYKKILTQLRSYLQGLPYDESIFLSDTKVLDDIVTDMCPPVNGMADKYYKIYGNIRKYINQWILN